MSRKGPAVQEEVSPNLIPMVDIMFLLLLFFMLGADMGQREFEEVRLPKAQSVKKDEETRRRDPKADRLTINVYHLYPSGPHGVKCDAKKKGQVCRDESHWRVGIKGVDFKDPELLGKRIKQEADLGREQKDGQISERKVMIRADESAPYGLAQRVMNLCAKAGIYKIEVGAARPAEEGKKKVKA